jgi:TPR repeat protein
MGWLAVLGYGGGNATANDLTNQTDANRAYEAFRVQLKAAQDAEARGDYAECLRILKPYADRGNEIAAYAVGRMYEDGKGVPKDMALARFYMEKAAKEGFGAALVWRRDHGFAPAPGRNWSAAQCAKALAMPPAWHEKYDLLGKVCPGIGAPGSAQIDIETGDILVHQYHDTRSARQMYEAAAGLGSAEAKARLAQLDSAAADGAALPPVCAEA